LKSNDFNFNPKERILYINNPDCYFLYYNRPMLFYDLIYFLAEELIEDPKLQEQLLKVNFTNKTEIADFMKRILELLKSKNIKPVLAIDQEDAVERKKSNTFFFDIFQMLNLKLFFSIISASNTNLQINQQKVNGEEINISSKDFLKDKNELMVYLSTLNYFKNHLENDEFLEEIIRMTGFNPFEIMELHYYYNKFLVDKNENEYEEYLEKMEEKYFHYRLSVIAKSHQNFCDENLTTQIDRNNFYELLPYLDLKKKLEVGKLAELLKLFVVDFNLMEVDQESQEITTITPASKLFLEMTYGVEQLYKKNEWHKHFKVLKTLFRETGDAKRLLLIGCSIAI